MTQSTLTFRAAPSVTKAQVVNELIDLNPAEKHELVDAMIDSASDWNDLLKLHGSTHPVPLPELAVAVRSTSTSQAVHVTMAGLPDDGASGSPLRPGGVKTRVLGAPQAADGRDEGGLSTAGRDRSSPDA